MSAVQSGRSRKDECRSEISLDRDLRREIPEVVESIVALHDKEGRFRHVGPEPMPSRSSVIDIIRTAINVIYPGYFSPARLDEVNVPYYFGEQVTDLYHALSGRSPLLSATIAGGSISLARNVEGRGQRSAIEFLKEIPSLQARLAMDIAAAYEGDPAAKYHDEIIFSYPGLFAVTVYRIAHLLHSLDGP